MRDDDADALRDLALLDASARRRWLVTGVLLGIALGAMGLLSGLGALTESHEAPASMAAARAPAGWVILGALAPVIVTWALAWAGYRWIARPRLVARWAREHGRDDVDDVARLLG